MVMDWTIGQLGATGIEVGPCAWHVSMLTGEHADYVHAHPSLVVAWGSDDEGVLRKAGPHIGNLPVLLGVREPSFARRLPGAIEARLDALGRDHVDILMLHADDPQELKGGGMLQTMFHLRQQGKVAHLGLAHEDIRAVEWIAANAAVRVLAARYSLADQAGRYRALPAADEYGMATLSLTSPENDADLRFALAQRELALPVLDRPLPEQITPMDEQAVEAAWAKYQSEHEPPERLMRGRPPE